MKRVLNKMVNLCLSSSFPHYFQLFGSLSVFGIQIGIRKAAENGSNLDPKPDTQHCLKLGAFPRKPEVLSTQNESIIFS